MKKVVLPILALCLCGSASAAAPAAAPGDWLAYGHDQGDTHYSPLTQITPANVTQLKAAWTYHMNPAWTPASPPNKDNALPYSEQTPLVIGGVLYLGTPYGRVVALDADTGKEIWVYKLPEGQQPGMRGVGYWPGDKGHGAEILFGTDKGLFIAIDARTGAPVKTFADNGVLNLRTPDVMKGYDKQQYGMLSPPSIYQNVAILNSIVQENPALGPAGDVRGVDVVTGRFLWTFHAIPQPGEKFHETWEGDSWKDHSGVNVWNRNTVDTKRGIAYLAFGAPSVDRDGSERHGANLFSDSVVAVEAKTGKYLWHFQATHHDLWDYDLNTPPSLIDVKKDGKTIPAVVVMNKPGLMFILNRVTGKPIYPVTETPMPASTVPTEQAWPTQPIPSKPPQLTRSGFALSEVANVTPELHAYCQGMIDRLHIGPSTRYTPVRDDYPILTFPSAAGGPEWAGGAFDPKHGLFIVNTNDIGYILRHGPVAGLTGRPRFQTNDPQPLLCQQPPWGDITAVDVNTGEIAWRHNFGVTDALPAGQQDTGRPNTGGPITTASGLIFIAATDDKRFRAYDTLTGRELWSTMLDYAGNATPATYLGKSGKQYVAILATGGTSLFSTFGGDSLTAYALP